MKAKDTQEEFQMAKKSRERLATLESPATPAPAFLETRVLATLESRKIKRRELFFWRGLSALSSSLALVMIFSRIYSIPSGEASVTQARTLEAIVVRFDVEALTQVQAQEIASAQIDLPADVYFYSQIHPELSDKRSLSLDWSKISSSLNSKSFPFAIEARKSGDKKVFVRFLDSNGNLISEKSLKIHFRDQG